jgi:two-component system, OmpR family, phosphate regulon sensor histidine kinase PhoR
MAMRLSQGFWRLFLLLSGLVVVYALGVAAVVSYWRASLTGESLASAPYMVVGAMAIAAIVAGIGITWWGVQQVVGPLAQLTHNVRAIAAGDDERPVASDGGDEMGVLAAAFNQMQRKLARRLDEVQENSQRLQTVLGSMVEGVLAVTPDKTILLANEAGRRMLDFATADPVGRSLLEVTRARPVYEAVLQALESAQPVEHEFDSPGLQRRTLALRATRLPGSPCPGVMIVLHDVSELRRLENLRRELVANVSHELKTPLAAIKAYAETLRMGAVNDPEHNLNFVHRIEEQAERLHQLILDMLQIARVEAGQETFDIIDVPLLDLLEECAAQFADTATAKQITLDAHSCSELLTARADEEGIRTILNNLVDNAIKYTPAGGRVTVAFTEEGDLVTLEVRDTGIGIAAKDQARVFERFYRVDKARSREMGGTGLGLSIVKHLAQAFGGSVGLESQLGKGATFRVKLPKGSPNPLAQSA